MKVGDLVRFIDKGTYSEWFFCRYAKIVEKSVDDSGSAHLRVRWVFPVKYFDRWTTMSDFRADKFEVVNESR